MHHRPGKRHHFLPTLKPVWRPRAGALLVLSCLCWTGWAAELPRVESDTAGIRHPLAIARLSGVPNVLVGNRCGTVSLVDPIGRSVVAEYRLGQQLSDVHGLASPGQALVLLKEPAALVWIQVAPEGAEERTRIQLPSQAWDLSVNHDESRVAVALRWRKQIAIIGCCPDDAPAELGPEHCVDLPFEPGRLHWTTPDQLLVADAFGGELALIDWGESPKVKTCRIDGHNLGGMCQVPGSDAIFVAHARLDQPRPLTEVAIEFGDAMKHRVARLTPDQIVASPGRGAPHDIIELGFTGLAATDPGKMVAIDSQTIAITLGGVGELSLLDLSTATESRLLVGQGPTDLTYLPAQHQLLVVNRFDDTISIVDIRQQREIAEISLGSPAAPSAAQRGEQLFFDATLARDRWMSCHSCHSHGHTNGLLADTLSDGEHGNPKRVLSLLGVSQTGPWGWIGSKSTLQEQVAQSVRLTMHGPGLEERQQADVAAYLESLQRPAPKPTSRLEQPLIERGQLLFQNLGCVDCHVPAQNFTSKDVYDVGLEDEVGLREFNPPSLQGIWYRRHFFHDKRADTLESVLRETRHQLFRELAEDEMLALSSYLNSL